MEPIELYKSHEQPPAWALKEIGAGRLKGKTDINPQWRILSLTKAFGLVGFGWKYTIDSQRIEEGASGEKVAFANISLYVKQDGVWSDAIIGTGGSSFVANEKGGAFTSDEAFKMAITDAISVACKQLGIGAAIYSGSKYDTGTKEAPKDNKPKEHEPQMTETQKATIIKHASLVEIFDEESRKKMIEWVEKPHTEANANLVIEKNEKFIHSKMQSV